MRVLSTFRLTVRRRGITAACVALLGLLGGAAPGAFATTTVNAIEDNLSISGSSAADQISVREVSGSVRIEDPAGVTASASFGASCQSDSATVARCTSSQGGPPVGYIAVRAMDGADTLNLGPERFTAEEREFDGGPGNDKIDDADSGDVVEGGEGDDEIDVSGDPAIGLRGAPRDIADCGPGTDAIAADTVDQVSNCENTSGTGGGGTGGGGGAGGGGTASQPQADGDGDGVPDSSDACPSTSGPAANAGCPVNAFSVAGKPQYKAGFTILKVSLPGSGVLKGTQTNVNKKHPALLKPALAKATQPGIVKLTFRPTAAGKRVLAKNGKLSVKTKLAYTPTGGKTASTVKRVAVYRRRFHG